MIMTPNPEIFNFFIDGEPSVVQPNVEQEINQYIEKYAIELEKNEAKAYEQSLKIYLNC